MSSATAPLPTSTTQSSDAQTPANSSTTQQSHRGRPRNRRGNQRSGVNATPSNTHGSNGLQEDRSQNPRGRGGRARAAREGLLALRPATVAPPTLEGNITADDGSTLTQDDTHEHGGSHRGRGRRGARGGAPQTRIVENRAFGGSLTATAAAQSPTQLQASAQEFRPRQGFSLDASGLTSNASQPLNAKSEKPKTAKHSNPHKRRLSKSTAPDIASRIHEDIENGQYECPICTSEVLRRSKVWSCHTCWTVFHLDCIKKWSINQQKETSQNAEVATSPKQWRCPGCNLPQDVKPTVYSCWCGKETEPHPPSGIPPHSCGQTCGRARLRPKKCPHPCELLCHAGPCPPCSHVGPTQLCFCGKKSSTKRCIDTNYDTGWSCGEICGDVMPCGEHSCPKECHDGLCGACEVRVESRCYCGKDEKAILCCDKDEEMTCKRTLISKDESQVTEEWIGMFRCANVCDRFFDCGNHRCQKPCHPSDEAMVHCPRSPDMVTTCPCGKTPLVEISDNVRQTCTDFIPNCSKRCLKELPCGHVCQQTCHIGDCMPCLEKTTIQCRCGRTSHTTICHQGIEEAPMCTRVCKATLNCGRHECGERCCSGERKAVERQSSKRRQRPLGSSQPVEDLFEAEHICTRVCGRKLKCGNHACQELCHKGPCGSCREAIFDEISCHCGRTVLQPPLPCGTRPPSCRFKCERPKSCGHSQVEHNCHPDEEQCPKCPFLIQKECSCGKKTLKNQPCWLTDVRCGEICKKTLKCGSHTCRKTCHKPGECEDQTSAPGQSGACQQPCGKPRQCCGHPCDDPCHAPYPCREEKPCTHKTLITCECQHNKSEVRCSASKTDPGNTTKVLPCNDECARLERNRKLAAALNIDPETHTDDHIPYSMETLALFQSSNMDSKWLKETEATFRLFAIDKDEKRLRFKPMPSHQRNFLHSLSTDFGFDSESMDPEPHRHVAVFKTPRFVSAPAKTLRDCVRIRRNKAAEAAAEAQTLYYERQAEKSRNAAATDPYNGLLLTHPRFALTIDELDTEVAAALGPPRAARVSFAIHFLPSGDVALKAKPAAMSVPPDDTGRMLDAQLREVKNPLSRAISARAMGALELARFDQSLNVVRRESDDAAEGGWSKVAAKAAAPRKAAPVQPSVGGGNGFTVLGTLAGRKKAEEKAKEAKKKKELEAAVVDDWEAAEVEAEKREEEQAAGSGSGAGDGANAVAGGSLDGTNDYVFVESADALSGDFESKESTGGGAAATAAIVGDDDPTHSTLPTA